MTSNLRPFDVAKHLKDEQDIELYLSEVAAGGDPAVIMRALSHVARARNMTELAKKADISREGLYKALRPETQPSFSTVVKLAAALGFAVSFTKASSAVTGDAPRAAKPPRYAAVLDQNTAVVVGTVAPVVEVVAKPKRKVRYTSQRDAAKAAAATTQARPRRASAPRPRKAVEQAL